MICTTLPSSALDLYLFTILLTQSPSITALPQAATAINTLNDQELDGRPLFVREDREDRDLIGFNGGRSGPIGGRGGRGGRGGYSDSIPAPRGVGRGPVAKRSRPIVPAGAHQQSSAGSGLIVGRRVYVSNLPWGVTWQDLKDHFRVAGSVIYADVMKDGDRSKGCGIVEYERPEEALHAISTLSNSTLGGRIITVREDREDRDIKGL